MSGGGYGQQQWGGQSGGNMYGTPDGFGGGKGYSLTGSQPWQNMATTNPVGRPSPMEQAFAPTQGMGGPMPGAQNAASGGTMGKAGGGTNPLAGMATTNPVYGGGMGGGMGGPMPAGQGGGMGSQPFGGGYGDYMNRRNAWIDQLRGYVSPPPQPTWGGQPGPGQPPVTAVPPGGPAPGPKAAGGGVDHMANLKQLMGQDPRLANEYRLRNGDTLGWWQQNQGNVAQGLFGGDNGKMQEWLRGTSPTSSNAAPLSQEEMMRLNQMAGIRGPSWMR